MDWDRAKTRLLVVQATPFCNIDCAYCYLPNRVKKTRLSFELAERIFGRLFCFPTIRDDVTVVWHAGEPLVLPPGYYEKMFRLIRRLAPSDLVIRHSFQTNGTLITDQWCRLIRDWDVNVGVSIDGPRDIHDLYRKRRDGSGSFDQAWRGLQLLQSQQIPFHVISVLTLESMACPDRMFEFYAESGITDICFNVEEQEGANTASRLMGSGAADVVFKAFLARFVDLAIQHRPDIFIREVEHRIGAISSPARDDPVNQQNEPFSIVSVDCDGNVSTFSPELLGLQHEKYGSFTFGNLAQDDFDTIWRRVIQSPLYADIQAGVRSCQEGCSYFGICGGGAPANKIYENGSAASMETAYCRIHYKATTDLVLDLIDRLPPTRVLRAKPSEGKAASNGY